MSFQENLTALVNSSTPKIHSFGHHIKLKHSINSKDYFQIEKQSNLNVKSRCHSKWSHLYGRYSKKL